MTPNDDRREWLEADGLGGFASGTTSTIRTRRYHALLMPATTPPTGRMALVNGAEVWVETPAGRFALSSQRYTPGVEYPDGRTHITEFGADPWPRWTFTLPDGTVVRHELFARHGTPTVVLRWEIEGPAHGAALEVRPLMSGRDYHSLHHENGGFRFDASREGDVTRWQPYGDAVPAVFARTNGEYRHQPDWFRNFLYTAEAERGLDATEDLASPGVFRFDLSAGPAVLMLTIDRAALGPAGSAAAAAGALRADEAARREALGSPVRRAADQYFVRRGHGATIVAGYPWFTDWGRDTFIALRGLAIATGRLADARHILLEWAETVSEGMLPNRFPDAGGAPEFNAVDASLWYVIGVHEYLEAAAASGTPVSAADRAALDRAVLAIVEGFARGTRFGIRQDRDGLLAAGVPGVQLTWMDARIGDWVVTPRVGKPVEVQALWINALRIAALRDPKWEGEARRAESAFSERFWNSSRQCLYDVVDADHVAGRLDPGVRPNQILAVGGLPFPILTGCRAQNVVETVERTLLTPLGLRSLAPGEAGYAPHYEGGPVQRDSVYHQGTVWPWLIGAFVDAWIRTRPDAAAARRDAARFVEPLRAHLADAGLGHVSEIVDAEPPHTPRGCPFQAWSLGELIRAEAALEAPVAGV